MSQQLPKFNVLPKHVGVIMDGNGRWAKEKGLSRSQGHKEGAKVFKRICEYACDLGIEHITFYAFSTENWSRPENEISAIMELLKDYLLEALSRKAENEQKGMKIQFIGDRSKIAPELCAMIETLETESACKTRTTVNLAVNYGGLQEIVHSVRQVACMVRAGTLEPGEITMKDIQDHLYTSGQPQADLIIRPSGEYRLSNFLTWQSAYAEFWFSDIMWPDFTEKDFNEALRIYETRNRRFGGI